MNETPTLEEIYTKHYTRIYNVCLRLLRDRDDAEDAVQEVMLHLIKVLPQYRGEAAFTTWLHRVVVNRVFETLRRRQRKWDKGLASLQGMAEDAEQRSALERAVAQEDRQLADVADRLSAPVYLARLTRRQRVLIELYMEGCSDKEMALLLNRTVPGIKTELMRAKIRMRGGDGVRDLLSDFSKYV